MDQPTLDDLIFAIGQLFQKLKEDLTYEGIREELPAADMEDIKASVKRLQAQGRISSDSPWLN